MERKSRFAFKMDVEDLTHYKGLGGCPMAKDDLTGNMLLKS